jgi:hypothetical protein
MTKDDRIHSEENAMYASNVESLYFFQKLMRGFTQERSPFHVSHVEKPLYCTLPLKCMKKIPLEKNPVYVNIVEKSSILPLIFKDLNKLTVERNPMNTSKIF